MFSVLVVEEVRSDASGQEQDAFLCPHTIETKPALTMSDHSSRSDPPDVGLSLMLEEGFRRAAEPLFDAGEVDVLEWSFDMGWGSDPLSAWAEDRLTQFSVKDRLLGHGVTFSPLSGRWTDRQQEWLMRFEGECLQRQFRHISEHFGFMNAGNFHQSAPLPVPLTNDTLRIGQDRLKRLADVAQKPVGLENLAFAFGTQDVLDQGRFLEELLRPVDGFMVLDLHNIYCQAANFASPAEQLIDRYPLDRVRELHVSGGSWSESQAEATRGPIRRDTHDEAVPDEVFDLVTVALKRCRHVEAVIFERLGTTLEPEDDERFRADFRRLKEICWS